MKDLVSQDGGIANLFVGLDARSVFFFLLIGLQFFLNDYVKNLFQVGSDDLNLVLDVFYAVQTGFVGINYLKDAVERKIEPNWIIIYSYLNISSTYSMYQ